MNKQIERLMVSLADTLKAKGLRFASDDEPGWFYYTGHPDKRSVWVTDI